MSALERTQSLQRVGALALVPALLRQHFVKPESVLTAAGLDLNALANPENTIPYAGMGLLLEVAAARTACPHFGLEIGERVHTATLGVVGELMRNAPTIGEAICDFSKHQHRNAHGGMVYLTKSREEVFWGYAVYEPKVRGSQILSDATAMAGCNLIRELAGTEEVPIMEVRLMRSRPMRPHLYENAFKASVHFDAEQTGIRLSSRCLNRRIRGADARRRDVLQERVKSTWYAGEMDTPTLVRRALRVGLIQHQTSATAIAMQLGMGRRTVQRRLNDANLPFQQLLDETRCDFAQQLLLGTKLNISEISAIVGYRQPGVFSRAFSEWVGTTPLKWRMAQ